MCWHHLSVEMICPGLSLLSATATHLQQKLFAERHVHERCICRILAHSILRLGQLLGFAPQQRILCQPEACPHLSTPAWCLCARSGQIKAGCKGSGHSDQCSDPDSGWVVHHCNMQGRTDSCRCKAGLPTAFSASQVSPGGGAAAAVPAAKPPRSSVLLPLKSYTSLGPSACPAPCGCSTLTCTRVHSIRSGHQTDPRQRTAASFSCTMLSHALQTGCGR